MNIGAPRGIRTPDHLIRSQVLYPAELPVHYLKTNYSLKVLARDFYSLSKLNFFKKMGRVEIRLSINKPIKKNF